MWTYQTWAIKILEGKGVGGVNVTYFTSNRGMEEQCMQCIEADKIIQYQHHITYLDLCTVHKQAILLWRFSYEFLVLL